MVTLFFFAVSFDCVKTKINDKDHDDEDDHIGIDLDG